LIFDQPSIFDRTRYTVTGGIAKNFAARRNVLAPVKIKKKEEYPEKVLVSPPDFVGAFNVFPPFV
jgi:hypothetical protein